MSKPIARTRADLTPGAAYALGDGEGWFYFGQIAQDKSVGFMKFRSRSADDLEAAFRSAIMCRVTVAYPSIGRALRSGKWKYLGRHPPLSALSDYRSYVMWPVGTHRVDVIRPLADGTWTTSKTNIDDPAIQNLEIAAVWDAEFHVPERLKTDFGVELGEWHIGGPVWRERKVAVEYGKRFPDAQHHVRRASDAKFP